MKIAQGSPGVPGAAPRATNFPHLASQIITMDKALLGQVFRVGGEYLTPTHNAKF